MSPSHSAWMTLCLGLALLGAPAPAGARDLTVALRDGLAADTLRTTYLDPFAAAGTPVAVQHWPGTAESLHANAAQWDMVATGSATLRTGCDNGDFLRLAWDKPPLRDLRQHLLPQAAADCGLGVALRATVLAWQPDRLQGAPSWADFWDVVKIPGKRGLRDGVRGNLEIALLADGVMPADIYRVLRTDAGVDRALRKLGQLRPYIVWWHTPADAVRILRSGEAVMTTAPAATAAEATPPLATQKSASITETAWLAILKSSPEQTAAQALLAFAADPARQARIGGEGAWGGMAKSPAPLLTPDQFAGALPIDDSFWRENEEKLRARFEALVTK